MQQQEITRRVEFLVQSAAGRGLWNRQYTAIPQAKITMVRPIRATQGARNPVDVIGKVMRNGDWLPAARAALSDRDGNFLRDHRRIERKVVGIPQHELERMLAGWQLDPRFGLARAKMKV